MIERISRVWMSVSGIINSHLIMARIVDKMGTAEQKSRFLPKFATGEIRGGLALTEPGCRHRPAGRAHAGEEGRRRRLQINGTKTWISNGIHGTCFALLVKTDPTAEPRKAGISMFLAEKGPGFRVSRKLEKLHYSRASIRLSWCSRTTTSPPTT